MARTLYLLRHGEAEAGEPGADDSARALTGRGRDAARRMGRELARRRAHPGLALCSTARRARETFDCLCEGLGEAGAPPPVAEFEEGLYLASRERLRNRIRAIDEEQTSVLIIGHNPGLHELAEDLAYSGEGPIRERLAYGFPAGALAILEFPGDAWSGTTDRGGKILALIRPGELG